MHVTVVTVGPIDVTHTRASRVSAHDRLVPSITCASLLTRRRRRMPTTMLTLTLRPPTPAAHAAPASPYAPNGWRLRAAAMRRRRLGYCGREVVCPATCQAQQLSTSAGGVRSAVSRGEVADRGVPRGSSRWGCWQIEAGCQQQTAGCKSRQDKAVHDAVALSWRPIGRLSSRWRQGHRWVQNPLK